MNCPQARIPVIVFKQGKVIRMLKSRGVTGALIILLALTAAASLSVLQGQMQGSRNSNRAASPSKDGEDKNFRGRFPVVAYNDETQPEERQREERKKKGRRYDKSGLVARNSSPEIEETVREVYGQKVIDALPAEQSTAIVLGEVQGLQAHLSNDKSGVYTEVLVRVDEVLKSDGSAGLALGSTISADRPGGIVKYPNGHERLYRIFGLNIPRASGRYVLFLNRDEGDLNYRILTGYELGAGGVEPLDVAPNFDAYKGAETETFLKAVRGAIAHS
jgi:hypothetical protein